MSEAVLVTGAGGFIGAHLAVRLAEHHAHVRALDLTSDRIPRDGAGRIESMAGDVADPEVQQRAVAGVDTVYHLAAAHLQVAAGDDEFRRVNVDGVASLLEASRAAGVRRFVHCSSVGVFGKIDDPPADEDSPCHPDIAYERSKLAGEEVVLSAVRDHGMAAVILRPAWVYGPGCPRTEKLFRTIGKGRFVVAGRGDGLRHCVFIDDMIRAFRQAADSDAAKGKVIIVGDAGAVTIRQLVDEIARLTGARPPRSVPLGALTLAAMAAEAVFLPMGKEPPISRRTLKFFTANTAFRIDRARDLLGYDPQYDLRSGLAETWTRLGGG